MRLSSRGVLYVGYKCNLSCEFCYYRHLEPKVRKWKTLGECKKRALNLRIYYGNNFVDLTGGEPSIFPEILDLVAYCRSIGLLPSLITNARVLSDKSFCKELQKAGVQDCLVSVHGLDNVYDNLVGVGGASDRQMVAIANLRSLDIPVRFNIVLLERIANQLSQIARLAKVEGIRIINLIMFNIFETWRSKEGRKSLAGMDFNFSRMAPKIKSFIDNLPEVEVNVRYFPFCQLKGYEDHIYNWRQLPYDVNEWDINSWYGLRGVDPDEEWYDEQTLKLDIRRGAYTKTSECENCSLRNICDGFNDLYVDVYGSEEIDPYKGTVLEDPKTFLSKPVSVQVPKSPAESMKSDLSLESLVGDHTIVDGYLVLSSGNSNYGEIELGYFDKPWSCSLFVKGPTDEFGFSFGTCQDLFLNIEDSEEHLIDLRIFQDGHYILTKDGEIIEPSSRDRGNLFVRPESFVGGLILLKVRQGVAKLRDVSITTEARSDSPLQILLTSVRYSRRLAVSLRSLGMQTNKNFEVLLATIRGEDDSEWVSEAVSRELGLNLRRLELSAGVKYSKADMVNFLLRASGSRRLLITDSDIIFPPDMVDYLVHRGRNPNFIHSTVERVMLDRKTTDRILLGHLDPVSSFERLVQENLDKVTKWGSVVRRCSEEPALGYFQFVDGNLAREIGYPSVYKGFCGSDDAFSLSILRRIGERETPLDKDKVVLHLFHEHSNWWGLRKGKWL